VTRSVIAVDLIEALMMPGDPPSLLDALRRPAWMLHAACKGLDPSVFFGSKREVSPEAAEVCARCPVDLECLQYALERPELEGCWGGSTEVQRKALRRSLAA
jgi:WhiB family redox-sensing transcriptional regulator